MCINKWQARHPMWDHPSHPADTCLINVWPVQKEKITVEVGLGTRLDGAIVMDLFSRSWQLQFASSAWGGGRAQHVILTSKC